jgi:hypothetical protein
MAAFSNNLGPEGLDDLSDLSSDDFEGSVDRKLSKLRVTEHELVQMVDLNEVSYSRDLKDVNTPFQQEGILTRKAKKLRRRKDKLKSAGPKLLPGKVKILQRAPDALNMEASEFVPSVPPKQS